MADLDDKIAWTPFETRYHHRYELRSWLQENFPFVKNNVFGELSPQQHNLLVERAGEIVDACAKVESIDLRANSAYIDYYKDDWKHIKDAYARKDYTSLAKALDSLLVGIDWE
jgi:hypothetical protein